jgi:hypothetical protein
MLRDVKCSQRLARIHGFRVDGTGTASILAGGFDGTLVDNGTGDYTITFTKAFAANRLPVCVGSAIGATAAVVQLAAVTTSTVQVLCFDAAGVAVDADFHLHVLGYDSSDET